MNFRVRIRSRARDDIRTARDWYEGQLGGLGERLGTELEIVMARIAGQPLLYPKVHKDVRRALTRHFPYAIYYLAESGRVSVLRILHQARDPEEWKRRT